MVVSRRTARGIAPVLMLPGLLAAATLEGMSMRPLFGSPMDGLSPSCQQAVASLQMRLQSNETRGQAIQQVTESLFASGRALEGLAILNAALQAPPDPNAQKSAGIVDIVAGFPWVSLGSPDSCDFVPEHHYCQIDVAGVYIRYGLCVPKGCNEMDVALALNQTYHFATSKIPGSEGGGWLSPMMNLVQGSRCGDVEYRWTWGTTTMIVITLVLLAFVALGTAVELLRRHKQAAEKKRHSPDSASNGHAFPGGGDSQTSWFDSDNGVNKFVLCFSLIKNWELLTAKSRGGPFDSLDGIRSLSMSWVIFGHVFIFALMGTNYSNISKILGMDGKGLLATYNAQAITGGYFAVDTFFFISAFLAVYLMLEQLRSTSQKRKSPLCFLLQSPYLFILRFLRLTPAYFYVVLMYWQVLRIASKGPFWGLLIDNDYKACHDNWWTNLLYINNFITVEQNGQPGLSCYAVSWYLAVDFQLFVITPLVAALAAWSCATALVALGVLTTGSIAYAWIESYKNNWSINFLSQGSYFSDYYIKPWTRAPSALIGMALAIVWFYHFRGQVQGVLPTRVGRVRKDRVLVAVLWCLVFFLFGSTVLGARGIYSDTPTKWSQDEMSAYIALSKPAWTLGLAIMCLLLFLGEGGPIKHLLECRPFTIISRLTYCMYLVHPSIIYWTYDSLQGPIHYSSIWYLLSFFGTLTTVAFFSTGVHLLVERPVANLERWLRGADKKKVQADGSYRRAALALEEETKDSVGTGSDLGMPLLNGPSAD